ncbi:MAG: hypothetical protein JW896_01840, partial [Deltaproteobacteria bacterium]|nr:hypothetical protein [Deltaproteobacteria bacterium]
YSGIGVRIESESVSGLKWNECPEWTGIRINGQIFEVWKGHVGIFVEPPTVREIVRNEEGWTSEELAEIIPRTLAKDLIATEFPETIIWD